MKKYAIVAAGVQGYVEIKTVNTIEEVAIIKKALRKKYERDKEVVVIVCPTSV